MKKEKRGVGCGQKIKQEQIRHYVTELKAVCAEKKGPDIKSHSETEKIT